MGDQIPKIHPSFPSHWIQTKISAQLLSGAVKRQWNFTSTEPINGEKILIEGVSSTLIDVFVNIELQNGEQFSKIIKANDPIFIIPKSASFSDVILTYTKFGIDHILLGFDHLLFVLALIIVTVGTWRIVKTVTAFTLAHSITLSLAALGMINIPVPPVEAVIALSIVFLAQEIVKHKKNKDSLTYRKPWIVAFIFGLLHGFGFASALMATGLPQTDIPLALAFFNVGVEIGQLAFVLVILLVNYLIHSIKINFPQWVQKSPPYLIGGMASYWVVERVVAFW